MKRILYFKKVLPTTILCSKVRSGGPESSEAYAELEKENEMLILKFGNELQTAMEGEDAAQGARMGIIDAAKRFDPTRAEGANFGTVAYNWAFRNSRARKKSDKRAGVYATSLDDPGSSEDGSTRGDDLRSTSVSKALVLDMREQIQGLPTDQRKVMLAIYSGDTVASAAKALKMKRSKVKSLRDTAFVTLRESLAGYVEAICD
jgi:RNA polymerase sigma factor (sigma-70 family)